MGLNGFGRSSRMNRWGKNASSATSPTDFSATLEGSTIHLTWINIPDTTADTIYIERRDNSAGELSEYYFQAQLSIDQVSYDDFVSDGTTYSYRLRYFSSGTSQYSDFVMSENIIVPFPSPSVSSFVTASTVILTWDYNNNSAADYYIERKTGLEGEYTQIGTYPNVYPSSTYIDSTIEQGADYYYRVRAHKDVEIYSEWTELHVVANPSVLPSAIDLTATVASETTANITWTNPTTIADYIYLERATSFGGLTDYTSLTVIDNSTATSYLDPEISTGVTYQYRIRYYSSTYEIYSDWVTSDTILATFPAPVVTVTENTANQVSLSWEYTNDPTTAVFAVERKTGLEGVYVEIGQVGASTETMTYTDSTVEGSTQYYYRVRAYKVTFDYVYSNWCEVDVTTPL